LCGADAAAGIAQLAKIYGECYDSKYWEYEGCKEEDTPAYKNKMSAAVKTLMNGETGEIFKQACANVLSEESRKRIEAAYTHA
jgi:hypothetical protein